MNPKYLSWIQENYPTSDSAFNQCSFACHKMKAQFPELQITNGTVQVGCEKEERTHWWLKTSSNQIIDPTAHQYDLFNMKIVFYNEIDDNHDLRKYKLIKCMNCGDKYFLGKNNWNNSMCCSDRCSSDLENYYNRKS